MQKFDNFLNSFRVLKNSKRELALSDEIYRTGVIGQFSLTFELLWKTLQESTWLNMVRDRNSAAHVYDEEAFNAVLSRIYDVYLAELEKFSNIMREKIFELEENPS